MKKPHTKAEDIVPLPRHSENFKVNRMISYIEKHWNDTIELEEIAQWAGSTPCYASALFSKTMCMTLVQYMNAFRINKASLLLIEALGQRNGSEYRFIEAGRLEINLTKHNLSFEEARERLGEFDIHIKNISLVHNNMGESIFKASI